MTLTYLRMLAVLSVVDPKAAIRMLLDLRLPDRACWYALALMPVLLTLISAVVEMMISSAPAPRPVNYFGMTVIHFVLIIVPAGLIHVIGERTGTTATFADALLTMLWLEFVLLPLQVIVLLLKAFSPELAAAALFCFAGLSIWLLTNFIAELHGYRSRLNVFLGIMTASLVMSLLVLPFMDPNFG